MLALLSHASQTKNAESRMEVEFVCVNLVIISQHLEKNVTVRKNVFYICFQIYSHNCVYEMINQIYQLVRKIQHPFYIVQDSSITGSLRLFITTWLENGCRGSQFSKDLNKELSVAT